MSLMASRLSSPKLPSALTKEIEMSRVELSESTRNRPALALLVAHPYADLGEPNVHLLLWVLVLEQVSAAVSVVDSRSISDPR